MPFPSAGCQTCKIRRIKCDETLPSCQRCVKSKRECIGMRSGEAYSVVHIENSYASGQRKRPRGPRTAPKVEHISKLELIRQPRLVDLKTQANAYYLHYHLQTPKGAPNVLLSVSNDLVPTWTSSVESPMLDLALSSMALAVFSQTQRHPPAAIEASMKYHRLLQIMRITVPSMDERNIDACLLAIFFMSRYEGAVHRPGLTVPITKSLKSYSHHDGATAVLKTWTDRLNYKHPSTDIIKHTRRGLIRSALLRNIPLPDWMRDGASFGEHGFLELEYDRIMVRIVGLRQRLSTLLNGTTSPQCTSEEFTLVTKKLNKEARDIDMALKDWGSHFPLTWYYKQHTLSDPPAWSRRHFYSETVYSYSSPAYAGVWLQYYATRMLINSTRLKVLKLRRPNSDDFSYERRLECRCDLHTMADALASSVPSCLQLFKVVSIPNSPSSDHPMTLSTDEIIKPYLATLAVWPLTIASTLGDLDFKHRAWFRAELAQLGRVIGAGLFEWAETDHWLEL